jgi:hypothetical protein
MFGGSRTSKPLRLALLTRSWRKRSGRIMVVLRVLIDQAKDLVAKVRMMACLSCRASFGKVMAARAIVVSKELIRKSVDSQRLENSSRKQFVRRINVCHLERNELHAPGLIDIRVFVFLREDHLYYAMPDEKSWVPWCEHLQDRSKALPMKSVVVVVANLVVGGKNENINVGCRRLTFFELPAIALMMKLTRMISELRLVGSSIS